MQLTRRKTDMTAPRFTENIQRDFSMTTVRLYTMVKYDLCQDYVSYITLFDPSFIKNTQTKQVVCHKQSDLAE